MIVEAGPLEEFADPLRLPARGLLHLLSVRSDTRGRPGIDFELWFHGSIGS